MDISVVIPAYNEENNIERTLKALHEQDPDEIIVVDNNSTDNTAKIARKYADKVLTQKKQGIAVSRNIGAANARNSIVTFIDADCIPGPTWARSVENAFTGNTIGVVGPVIPQEDTIKNALGFFLSWTVISKFLIHINYPCFHGGNCAYDQQVFIETEGFKEDIMPGEDVELSLRLRESGKFKFIQGMVVSASARRFEKDGYLLETIKWLRIVPRIMRHENFDYSYPAIR